VIELGESKGGGYMEVYTIEEVAKMLKVSEQTIRALVRDGTLPAKKVGRAWRIKKTDFEAYMNSEG